MLSLRDSADIIHADEDASDLRRYSFHHKLELLFLCLKATALLIQDYTEGLTSHWNVSSTQERKPCLSSHILSVLAALPVFR